MIERVKAWVNNQLALGEFSSRKQVLRRAARMALRIAALAYAINVVAHLILYAADLLPYDLFDALVVATILTPLVSSVVAFVAYYVVGLAVYDLAISRAEFERLSRTDPLSGLLNRRAFLEAFEAARSPSALALFDVDRFKSINDTLGHVAGDQVIVAIAQELACRFGGEHIVARIGGEEFVVLLCGIPQDESARRIEEVRSGIERLAIICAHGEIAVTISAGLADHAPGRSFDDIFSHADRALYMAKVSGRNRVVHESDIARLAPSTRNSEAVVAEAFRNAIGIRT
ncbi:GGDEF domain-containing protein [Rhizobium sp. ARZ01]|uniref:GGDEF domain-containing protein n=1 Tax=Rhizobium sp. ARZ01 TaxID=2769313 RepID=UPI00178159F5|nr:GGDEF domain-containing protein [Rhizobium sp. ARZ01]MBD9372898.1 GGDEF domain-containing protein [Rhizobium sp. ARZ01]